MTCQTFIPSFLTLVRLAILGAMFLGLLNASIPCFTRQLGLAALPIDSAGCPSEVLGDLRYVHAITD
jgi:hypothetical protein